jgi:molybdate transport system ATP-binding protein
LFGPSGAGKTTIINAVAGLLKPRSGRIVINGRVVLDTDLGVSAPIRERRVGYVFQDFRLFPHMNVENNLLFGWRRAARRLERAQISQIVELLGLAALLRRAPRNLSGGERQRVAIGRALLSSPELLLLDEPMAALDAARRAEILPYLERLKSEQRVPMLYVSHTLEEVARLADEIVLIAGGRVTRQGPVFEMVPEIESAAGTVLPVVMARQRDDGLSELAFTGGQLAVQRLAAPVGSALRVRIAAQDVMLAIAKPEGISANNVLAGTIVALRPAAGLVDVHLSCGGSRLISRITQASTARLGLVEGMNVFAIIKAVTVDAQISPLNPLHANS